LKIVWSILLWGYTLAHADGVSSTIEEIKQLLSSPKEEGCHAAILNEPQAKCSSSKPQKIVIEPIHIPDKKDKKIAQIESQLNSILKEFSHYKKEKDQEIQKIYTLLSDKDHKIQKVSKKLSKNERKLTELQKKIKTKKAMAHRKRKSVTPKKQPTSTTSIASEYIPKEAVFNKDLKRLPPLITVPWIEVQVENDVDIYQLALRYYKDKQEYKQIYVANRDVIGRDLKLRNGMSLKIPMTEKFEDQPIFINQ